MIGIVMCFNADDLGIEFDAIHKIMRRVSPGFTVQLPLRKTASAEIRRALRRSKLRFISCMVSDACGFCAKCLRRSPGTRRSPASR
jgi:hypothetical protein